MPIEPSNASAEFALSVPTNFDCASPTGSSQNTKPILLKPTDDDEAFEKYKAHRLKTVSIATVDRELSKARKMFGVALSKKWVFDNPFKTEAGKQVDVCKMSSL